MGIWIFLACLASLLEYRSFNLLIDHFRVFALVFINFLPVNPATTRGRSSLRSDVSLPAIRLRAIPPNPQGNEEATIRFKHQIACNRGTYIRTTSKYAIRGKSRPQPKTRKLGIKTHRRAFPLYPRRNYCARFHNSRDIRPRRV